MLLCTSRIPDLPVKVLFLKILILLRRAVSCGLAFGQFRRECVQKRLYGLMIINKMCFNDRPGFLNKISSEFNSRC